jgi:hypothetical protein
MGGVILIFIVALLIVILVTPALRARRKANQLPPAPEGDTHEVVVHRLDDHRKTKPGDDPR